MWERLATTGAQGIRLGASGFDQLLLAAFADWLNWAVAHGSRRSW
jgi:hypothetical protein